LDQDSKAIDLQMRALALPRFSHDDGWWLGCHIRELARARGASIAISIRRGATQIFAVAVEGATADRVDWAVRKIATAMRFERSSYAVALDMRAKGMDLARFGLTTDLFALAGGAVPLLIEGVGVVGGVAVSGMSELEDHEMVVEAMSALKARMAADA